MNRIDRMQLRKRKQWIIYSVATAILVILLLSWFYRSIQEPLWDLEQQASELAIRDTQMTEVEETYSFIHEDSFVSVIGKDQEGQELLAWISMDTEQADQVKPDMNLNDVFQLEEGITESEARNLLLERSPQTNILRIQPGQFDDEWVWEIFHKQKTEQGTRHYYDYFRLTDGEWLETYRLAVTR